MEHPNAVVFRQALEKLMAGETEALRSLIADDVVWWQIGSDQPVRGLAALLAQMQTYEGAEFKLDIHDVLANDEHTVALVTATVGAGDQAFSYRTAEIVHITDGKITERWAFSDDTAAINDFFAELGAG